MTETQEPITEDTPQPVKGESGEGQPDPATGGEATGAQASGDADAGAGVRSMFEQLGKLVEASSSARQELLRAKSFDAAMMVATPGECQTCILGRAKAFEAYLRGD